MMPFEWTDRVDDEDVVFADDVNSLAKGIQDNEKTIEDKTKNLPNFTQDLNDSSYPYHTDDGIAMKNIKATDGHIDNLFTNDMYFDDVVVDDLSSGMISSAREAALMTIRNADEIANLATVAKTNNYNDLDNIPVPDSELSSTSENSVQNKVIKAKFDDIEEHMTLTADDTNSLSTALTSIKATGGKIILTGNTPIRMPSIALATDKQYIIEGENENVKLVYVSESAVNDSAIIVFRNLTMTFATADSRNFIFENCNIENAASYTFCNNTATNLTFLNCTMAFICPETVSVTNYNIIQSASEVIIDNHCRIYIDTGYTAEEVSPKKRFNFIMRCSNAVITNSYIETNGGRLLCYLFGNGTYRITNNTILLNDKGNSLFRNVALGSEKNILAGNQISVNQDTYIRAVIITANVFDIKNNQTADNCFKLLCDNTKITNCTFLTNAAYMDCRDNICMIKDNSFDGGVPTIINAIEGSIIKDNL